MSITGDKIPYFKKIDTFVFAKIDQFKSTPNYNGLIDLYGSLEEETQKALKIGVLASLFIAPSLIIALLLWQNSNLQKDLDLRKETLSKANQIIGQKKSLNQIKYSTLSQNPIESDSMLTSKLSGILTSSGVDISKIKVTNFESDQISGELFKSQARLNFNNFSTEELTSLISSLMKREKFKVSDISITRNDSTNFLQGYIQVSHLAQVAAAGLEE